VVTSAEIDKAIAGQTGASRFADRVAERPKATAIRWKEPDGIWRSWTFTEYADRACRIAAGLTQLGIKPGDRVVLMMRNRPEFHISDLGVLLAGATPISIYNSNSPEQIQYVAHHCAAKLAIVEDAGYLERFLKIRDELPDLSSIVLIDDDGSSNTAVPFSQLLDEQPLDLDAASRTAKPEDLVTVIYTSGTTGPPKGVMLSHYNLCWTAESLIRAMGLDPTAMRVVSYLPMAHIAERTTSHYFGAGFGAEVIPCPETGLLAGYLREVRPTLFFGVPRIWEKMHATVQAALGANPDQKAQFQDAVETAKPLVQARDLGHELTKEQQETLSFLDAVAFSKVRQEMGLDQVEVAVTGAAPIPPDLIAWYRAVGVPLSEIYGMSESSGPMTWDPYRVKIGAVGRAIPGCEVKLLEDGEVACRGGNVFVGYLNDPGKTAETKTPDGWLLSGDIGEFDDEGYLRIVDRKKELIITAGGKNISPANLEAALKSMTLIGQACVIGDDRPFISALVVLDPEVAPPWAAQHGLAKLSMRELAQNADLQAEITREVGEANQRFSHVEQVKKWVVLADEWLPDSTELTPTMKLKRRDIATKYAAEIEGMYAK
jgi:long-chain acyl-CoA synthetase